MEIKTQENGNAQFLTLAGRLDAVTATDFEKIAEHLLHAGHRMFLIDAQDLEYVSSSGIGALAKWARSLDRAGGACAIVGAGSEVRWLLQFFGLSRQLPHFGNLSDAERFLTERSRAASHLSILTTPRPASAYAAPRAIAMDMKVQEPRPKVAGSSAHAEPAQVDTQATAEGGQLGANLSTLEASLARVIDSLERIPDTIRELREQNLSTLQPKKASVRFAEGIVVDCQRCGSHLRIKKTGEHLCPRCAVRFSVNQNGTAHFSERPSSWQAQQETHSASHS
ncbi:MAG: STAS domain-containing protein [Spirochaetia bacterium]|nr:STAS domain-containing protein [Spirochaetia bacterium]